MTNIITEALSSPLILTLSICLFITESITVFDIRIVQAKRLGNLPPDHPELPMWTRVFHFLEWVFRIALLVCDWKFALIFFVTLFVLKVLPVLETIGNILMSPFKKQMFK